MNLKFLTLILLACCSVVSFAQSKTTEALHKDNQEALSLFFYHNTLRMLNQKDDSEFDELIKNIEKMKFLMIDKKNGSLNYKKIVSDYKAESFEEAMTSRHEGKNFDVFMKEKGGKTTAMLVLINDDKTLFVLDILGSIALNQVTKLYSTLDESADIGKKIKVFTSDHEKD